MQTGMHGVVALHPCNQHIGMLPSIVVITRLLSSASVHSLEAVHLVANAGFLYIACMR